VRVELGGVTVADSTNALRVLETSHPPTIYVPPGDIAAGCLTAAAGRSFCEWKGIARYFDVVAGGRREAAAGWAYPDPAAPYEALRDHVAFYPGRMDACWLGRPARALPAGRLLRRLDHGGLARALQGRARHAHLVTRRALERAPTAMRRNVVV